MTDEREIEWGPDWEAIRRAGLHPRVMGFLDVPLPIHHERAIVTAFLEQEQAAGVVRVSGADMGTVDRYLTTAITANVYGHKRAALAFRDYLAALARPSDVAPPEEGE